MKNITDQALFDCMPTSHSAVDNLESIFTISRIMAGLTSDRMRVSKNTNTPKEDAEAILNKFREIGYTTTPVLTRFHYICVLEDNDNNCIKMFAIINLTHDNVEVICFGDTATIEEHRGWLKNDLKKNGSRIYTATGISERGKIEKIREYIATDEVEVAKQVFYPFLSVPLAEYFDAFMESDESVLILFGPPGTGKSTFLRTLITSRNYTGYLAYDKTVVESPIVVRDFYNSEATILAYEDIDRYLGARSDGNTLMSTFLNASDGVVKKKNKKIVFSTNLNSIDKIDPALLRRGRCFDILQFDLLTVDQSLDVIKEMGLPDRDLSAKNTWSLSEILNPPEPIQQSINRFGKKAGFY